jgi:hypothetical protein
MIVRHVSEEFMLDFLEEVTDFFEFNEISLILVDELGPPLGS